MQKKYKILSTFTGCGGLDIGFHGNFSFLGKNYEALPFETIVSLDNNRPACDTLENDNKYFDGTRVVCGDITDYKYLKDIDKYLRNKKIKDGELDLLLGGFPCVTFSVVGKQAGVTDDINGKLYESFAKYVENFRPKVFLAENVKGILSANKGEAIKIIKERFEIEGYKLKIFLVKFADFGVPQLRERVVFIGVRNDINTEFIPPEFTHLKNHVNCEQAFAEINQNCPNNNLLKINQKTEEMLKRIPEGENYKAVEGTKYAVKGLMSNIYRRLKRNAPAYTVIASGGGGTWTYHYKEPRALTNRERARLQTFPDDLIFAGSTTEVRRQIGNAVPPVGIYPFAERIALVLQGKTPEKYNLENCIKELKIEKRNNILKISDKVQIKDKKQNSKTNELISVG